MGIDHIEILFPVNRVTPSFGNTNKGGHVSEQQHDDVAPDADEPGDETTPADLEQEATDVPAKPDEVNQKPEDVDE